MEIVVRATILFFLLLVVFRLMGKRELAETTPFEIVLLVVLGDLIQQGVTRDDYSLTGAVLAVTTFASLAVIVSFVASRSKAVERAVDGRPVVIAKDGQLYPEVLKRDRLTVAEVEQEMRQAGIAQLSDVSWAVIEPNGKISFIKRSPDEEPKTPPTRRADTIGELVASPGQA